MHDDVACLNIVILLPFVADDPGAFFFLDEIFCSKHFEEILFRILGL